MKKLELEKQIKLDEAKNRYAICEFKERETEKEKEKKIK